MTRADLESRIRNPLVSAQEATDIVHETIATYLAATGVSQLVKPGFSIRLWRGFEVSFRPPGESVPFVGQGPRIEIAMADLVTQIWNHIESSKAA